jgi:hypothetical protein
LRGTEFTPLFEHPFRDDFVSGRLPAMDAVVADHVWILEEVIALLS